MSGTIVDRLRGKRLVFFDTAPIVYLLQDRQPWVPIVASAFGQFVAGGPRAVSSVLTLMEVLVKPFQEGRLDLVRCYRERLGGADLPLIPCGREEAEVGARIRAEHGFKAPDAIQLATAVRAGADGFVTNDRQLRRFRGIDVVVLADFIDSEPTSR